MFSPEVAPEFEATIDIPVAGKAPEPVVFTFRHKDRDAFDALAAEIGNGKTLDDACREIVVSWKAPNWEFSQDALTTCFQKYAGSAGAIFYGYRAALVGAQRKN